MHLNYRSIRLLQLQVRSHATRNRALAIVHLIDGAFKDRLSRLVVFRDRWTRSFLRGSSPAMPIASRNTRSHSKGGQLSSTDEAANDDDDPEMYETERWGHFSYAIQSCPASMQRRSTSLSIVSILPTAIALERRWSGAHANEDRLFSVFCNGKVILRDLDLIKEVGGNRSTGSQSDRPGGKPAREIAFRVRS